MSDRNASASVCGWDFQTNSAILLMLENIKDAKRVRVEGADEDIEITLQDQTKLYAQAKAVEKPDDTSHVIDKLTKALETLSDAAKKGDGSLFTYVTNSSNPFNNQRTLSYFTGRTHLDFDELPTAAQKKINEIIQNNGYTALDVHKLDVRVIPGILQEIDRFYPEQIQKAVDRAVHPPEDLPGHRNRYAAAEHGGNIKRHPICAAALWAFLSRSVSSLSENRLYCT